jgi:hypothetical protein
MDTTSVTDEKYICFQVSVWIHSALHKKCVSTKEKAKKPISMQIEQVRNWLVLLMVFAYIPRSKASLPFRFLTKIYRTYRTCSMRLQSSPVFSFGEFYFWLEEKPIQRLPRNSFGYHVTCHFSTRVSAVGNEANLNVCLSETHVCLRANYIQAWQLTQIRIIITRNHVNRWCVFVCLCAWWGFFTRRKWIMGDITMAEQTPSSHRNTGVNINPQSNFKTPTFFRSKDWTELRRARVRTVLRLQTHVIYHMKQSLKLADLNDEWLDSFYYSPISWKSCRRSLVVNMPRSGKSAVLVEPCRSPNAPQDWKLVFKSH